MADSTRFLSYVKLIDNCREIVPDAEGGVSELILDISRLQ